MFQSVDDVIADSAVSALDRRVLMLVAGGVAFSLTASIMFDALGYITLAALCAAVFTFCAPIAVALYFIRKHFV